MMITYLHLVQRLKMNGAISLLLLYTIITCKGKTLSSPYLFSALHKPKKKKLIHIKFAPLSSDQGAGVAHATYVGKKVKVAFWSFFNTEAICPIVFLLPTSSRIHLQRSHASYRCARPLPAKAGTITKFC